jgi:hypothetical protein
MFKSLKGGMRRSSGGGSRPGRVSATRMGNVAPLSTQSPRTVAFQPDTPQEHGFDSRNSRVNEIGKG